MFGMFGRFALFAGSTTDILLLLCAAVDHLSCICLTTPASVTNAETIQNIHMSDVQMCVQQAEHHSLHQSDMTLPN